MEGMFIYPSRTQPLPFSPFICLTHHWHWRFYNGSSMVTGSVFGQWSMVTGSSQPRLSFPAIKGQLRHLDVMANICDQTSNSDKHGKVLFRRIDPKKVTPSKSIGITQKIIKNNLRKHRNLNKKCFKAKQIITSDLKPNIWGCICCLKWNGCPNPRPLAANGYCTCTAEISC